MSLTVKVRVTLMANGSKLDVLLGIVGQEKMSRRLHCRASVEEIQRYWVPACRSLCMMS
jgi:hypothetical protein